MFSQDKDLWSILPQDVIAERRKTAEESLFHYIARSKNWLDRTPEIRVQFISHLDPPFVRLVDTNAILHIAEIHESAVTLPRWQDMLTVGGETDYRLFLDVGRDCYDLIRPHIPENHQRIKLLDFGVGCARTARHFYRDIGDIELHGCDIDAAPIEYLRKDVPHVMPIRSRPQPPLPYQSGFMDAVYCVSVFTHFDLQSFGNWMEELARCIKPKGCAIISFHGSTAWNAVQAWDDARVKGMGIEPESIRSAAPNWSSSGFVWVPQHAASTDIDSKQFGCTFTDEAKLNSLIPRHFRLVSYSPGAIGGWQDLAVFERV